MAELDPFSQVHNALWDMIERNSELQSMLSESNKIKYDVETSQKDQISDADLPELVLLSNGMGAGDEDNSSQRTLKRVYTWGIATGDFRINESYNKLCFELYRAMIDAEIVLCPLTWKGNTFINDFRILKANEGLLMRQLERGIRGWSGLWDCQVHFSFCLNDLRLEVS